MQFSILNQPLCINMNIAEEKIFVESNSVSQVNCQIMIKRESKIKRQFAKRAKTRATLQILQVSREEMLTHERLARLETVKTEKY